MSDVLQLPDGSYDGLIVDAVADGESIALEITIVAGPHKGDVVGVRASGLDADELELLGMPGTLTVTNGEPHFAIEP